MPDYENGKIPPSLLRRVSNFVPLIAGVTSGAGSDLLREDAWAALNMLQVAFLQGFERPLNVSEAYRGLNRQTATWQTYKAGGPFAAVPGTSPHGWALAADFGSGVATFGSAAKYWMDRNAPRWGWHPTGNSFPKPEAWHFEFRPGTATEIIPASSGATPFPDSEDEMTDDERKMLQEIHNAMFDPNTGVFPRVNTAADHAVANLAETKIVTGILAKDVDPETGLVGIRGDVKDIRKNAYLARASSGNAETIIAKVSTAVDAIKKKLGA